MSEDKEEMIGIYVQIITKNDMPSLQIRTSTSDINLMKTILNAAFSGQPLIIMPQFRNKIKSISTLIDKGIMYKKDNEYYFCF